MAGRLRTDDDSIEELVSGAAELSAEDVSHSPAPPRLSALVVLLGVVVAGLVGLAVGLFLLRGEPGTPPPPVAAQLRALPSPSPPEPEVLVSPPAVRPPAPSTSVFLVESPVPAPPPPPPAEPQPLAPLEVEPSAGGNGAELYVLGSGWAPGSQVVLTYLGVAGEETGSRTTVVVDEGGTFGADLLAEDPTERPGRHLVRATDGTRVVEAPYDVQE